MVLYSLQGDVINFPLTERITFLRGDSGIGKTAMFKYTATMRELSDNAPIIYIDEYHPELVDCIMGVQSSVVFVIDHWEVLSALREDLSTIVRESPNKFIVIGREKRGLPAKGVHEVLTYIEHDCMRFAEVGSVSPVFTPLN